MGDRWLTDLPVDEVVPMLFDMGTGAKEIIRGLEDGKDWSDPRCRSSYGMAIYEKIEIELKTGRRMYYFNNRAWKPADTIDLF